MRISDWSSDVCSSDLATLLALGEGVDEDKAAAFGWLEKAAAMGNAKAINFVGSFHEDGWVVTRDVDKAADCYARAAEGGDFRGCFNHARLLGLARSEEHTSELQSLMRISYAVFCLKKKNHTSELQLHRAYTTENKHNTTT